VEEMMKMLALAKTALKNVTGKSPLKVPVSFEDALRSCLGDSITNRTYEHTLYNRDVELKCLAGHLEHNFLNRSGQDHKDHRFVLVTGASGLGKTRFGFEASRSLVQFLTDDGHTLGEDKQTLLAGIAAPLYIYINFNNGEQYDNILDDHRPAAVRLGVRLAATGLLNLSMSSILLSCKDLNKLDVTSVMSRIVLDSLSSGNQFSCIIVHLDEFPFYVDARGTTGMHDFKAMLHELGKFMREGLVGTESRGRFCVLPILTGTSSRDVELVPSDYGHESVTLSCISDENALQMFKDKFGADDQSVAISEQSHFRVALSDAGGIPSYIAALLSPTGIDLNTAWGVLLASGVRNVENLDPFGGVEGARVVLDFALTATPVTRTFILPGGKSVGDMERNSVLFLLPLPDDRNQCHIHMPFVQLTVINKLLVARGHGLFDDNLLFSPSLDRPWYWQDFEKLHAQLQVVRINALLEAQKAELDGAVRLRNDLNRRLLLLSASESGTSLLAELQTASSVVTDLTSRGKRGFSISSVIPGALGLSATLERRVRLRPMKPFQETSKFLTLKTDIAPLTASIDCVGGQFDLTKGVFLCSSGNAHFDGRFACNPVDMSEQPVLFVWQDKHSALETVNDAVAAAFVLTWLESARSSMSKWSTSFDVVFVFLTNRRLTGSLPSDMPPDLLVISRSELAVYLSPSFAGRGLLAHNMPSSSSSSSSSPPSSSSASE
jgi:hypothetical protein